MLNTPEVSQVSAATVTQKPTRIRAWVIFITFISMLVAYLDRVNVSIIIADPNFKAEMGIMNDPFAQGLLMSCFLWAYGGGMFFLGPIGDVLGPRKATMIAIFSWGVSISLGALSRTINVLYMTRFLLGLGEALHMPMLSKYTKNWIPPKERGTANSGWNVGFMVGPALALPLFTMLVGEWGWRPSYWFCVVWGFAILPLIWWATDKPEQHKGVNKAELDYILEGQKEEAAQAQLASGTFSQNLGKLLTNSNYLLNVFTYWGSTIMWWGFMSWLPAYLKVARGFSWAQMGWLSSLPYILGAISTMAVGIVADKYSPNRRAPFSAIGMAGCALSIYLGATIEDNLTAAYAMAMAMFFIGMHNPTSWTILQKIVPSNLVGTASGIHNGTSQFIGAFVPAVVGYLISTTGGSYTAGLMCLVAAGAIGACCVTVLVFREI
ncbi:MAG: MFS transporter [Negativicutes bacterium]|nr:MFS transporter [Negativicutes bacterium]